MGGVRGSRGMPECNVSDLVIRWCSKLRAHRLRQKRAEQMAVPFSACSLNRRQTDGHSD